MVYGFPTTGRISRKYASPLTAAKLPTKLAVADVLSSASARFIRRSARAPPMADALWEEATRQVELGWLDPPRLLSDSCQIPNPPSTPRNVAFRFAVARNSKVRACGDLKESLKNKLRTVFAPITLPDWDLLAAMRLLIAAPPARTWLFSNRRYFRL